MITKNEFCDVFEYELRNKLSERSKSSFDEIRLLLNCFKFYDLDYKGIIDKIQWIRGVLKTGVTGFTEEDLSSIFSYYDKHNSGLIDYFNFVNYLYGKESLKPLPKEPYTNVFSPYNINNNNNNKSNNNNNIIEYKNESFNIINNNKNNYMGNKNNNYLIKHTNQSTQNLQLKYNNNYMDKKENESNEEKIKKFFEELLMKIKSKININNGITFYTFAKKLKILEINNKINLNDLIEISKDMKLDLTEKDIKNFFILLDIDQMHFLDINLIINIIKGKMSQERRLFVSNKFYIIDKRQKGEINVNFMKIIYKNNAKFHPDVIQGKKTEESVYNQFRQTLEIFLEINKILNDIITKDQFINYYSGISASIHDDHYFKNVLNAIWDLSKIYTSNNMNNNNYMNNLKSMSYAKKFNNYNIKKSKPSLYKSISTPEINAQRILTTPIYNNNNYEKNLLQMNYNRINKKYNQKPEIYNDIISKEEENRNMNNIGDMNYIGDPYYRPRITPDNTGIKLFNRIIYNPITKEFLYSNERYNNNNEHNIINGRENQSFMKRYKNNKFLFDEEKYNEQKLIELFNKLRNTIIAKGDKSIFNLQKLLYEFNTDCHPFLISFENFLEIIQKLGINNFTIEEIRKIFIFLDNNKAGYINYDIFFRNLVGYMGRNRQALVRTVYESLRKDQYGNIFYIDFKQLFNADKYNEIFGGRKTKEYIYYEFVDNLNIFLNYRNKLCNDNNNKKRNNIINYDDFLKFFSQISMYLDSDDTFEKYINYCWKNSSIYTPRENKNDFNLINNKSSMFRAGGHIVNW